MAPKTPTKEEIAAEFEENHLITSGCDCPTCQAAGKLACDAINASESSAQAIAIAAKLLGLVVANVSDPLQIEGLLAEAATVTHATAMPIALGLLSAAGTDAPRPTGENSTHPKAVSFFMSLLRSGNPAENAQVGIDLLASLVGNVSYKSLGDGRAAKSKVLELVSEKVERVFDLRIKATGDLS